jgi:hypothetical protein
MSLNQLLTNTTNPLDIVVNTINGNPPDVVDSSIQLFKGLSFISTTNPNLEPSIGMKNCTISVEDKKVVIGSSTFSAKLVKGNIGFICKNAIVPAKSSVEVKTNGIGLPTELNQQVYSGVITTSNPVDYYTTSSYLSQAVMFGDSDITFTINLTQGLAVNDIFTLDFEVLCSE